MRDKTIRELARVIRLDWKHVNYAAEPYLAAMGSLEKLQDTYGLDSGKSIVRYFLANATTWRGEVARQVKSELQRRLREGDIPVAASAPLDKRYDELKKYLESEGIIGYVDTIWSIVK